MHGQILNALVRVMTSEEYRLLTMSVLYLFLIRTKPGGMYKSRESFFLCQADL